MENYDWIVVGAGSAGCVVAGRLAEAGRGRILVLEAGPRDLSPWIHLPIGYGKTFYAPRLNWMYRTEPVPGLDGRVVYQPRGKVVGGSSSINAMVWSRGQAEDFDGWAAAGNPGWSGADVLAAYRRMEDHALGASDWHGAGGPVHISDIAGECHPLTALFVRAGLEAGLPANPDLNGATTEGVGHYQITTRNGRRVSAATAYLKPALKTGRVRLVTGALAERILFEGQRAVGIRYRRGGRVHEARAGGGVILTAGAFNSPQLLQLSGIGPADLLARHGIAPRVDRPAVGRHLQDHLCYDHVYRARRPSLNDDLLPLIGQIRAGLAYLFGRRGPLSLSVNQGGGFFRTRADLDRPDMQLYFSPLSYERALPGVRALMKPDPFSGFSTSVSPCRPTSRGHVAIRSADPSAAPSIVPNYLDTEEDRATILAGARFLRRLAATPTFRDLIADELKPGPACGSDEALAADIRARAYSVFHPCGTCRMGPDPADHVVGPDLKVHGVDGLRVADASIFPTVPSGNTNAPAMMVGWMAADRILAETAARR
ncbi:choline dehydrogenase [Prosthecomicrobium hirschii]|uniref:GMC family oxidoreductase n=1 Tax=Prosthecodimorpha hirschii TaxID=665126 RepID=UPI00112707CD|nr:GMC family oxidoreductase N-terminal domain-containing protein [Prosthecomicrobium hirschii]TPQ50611.1 choline dehydrogenase [Prosthecomicrobium hirschii]